MIENPIWKDTYYTTEANSAEFRIQLEGQNIFSGKAVKYPDAEELEININKVCRNYLDSDIAVLLETMPTTNYRLLHPDAMRTFNFFLDDVNVEDYTFWNDWSYEE